MRLRILIALALVGALAGCQESGFDESKETQRPLKVQDAMNPLVGTKVPGQAERPFALSADSLGDTAAPWREADGRGARRRPRAAIPPFPSARGIEVLGISFSPDLAAIAAAGPDVILGAKESSGDLYDDLRRSPRRS